MLLPQLSHVAPDLIRVCSQIDDKINEYYVADHAIVRFSRYMNKWCSQSVFSGCPSNKG